jgi:hypothetical protein
VFVIPNPTALCGGMATTNQCVPFVSTLAQQKILLQNVCLFLLLLPLLPPRVAGNASTLLFLSFLVNGRKISSPLLKKKKEKKSMSSAQTTQDNEQESQTKAQSLIEPDWTALLRLTSTVKKSLEWWKEWERNSQKLLTQIEATLAEHGDRSS